MSVSVKEVFDLAVELDLDKLAHRVYWALTQQKASLTDSSDKLTTIQYDEDAIESLIEKNSLGIGRVKLFVIQTSKPGWYAFYFAQSGLEASSLHSGMFNEKPTSIVNAPRLMIPLMTFAETGVEMNLYERRKKLIEFPAYIGHAEAGKHVLYKMRR
ncbi:MAG TPA: hypothetical protein K8V56_13620 [Sporosarcina psychrophila]|uniref:Uncharacterized protein n=1 Tax=Sporosarcina psychrophila TaxID=1476 RepID=A0A921G102_SPOPS|nr:hypothetical protein [Sporosarcina psychrophila]